MRNYFSHDSNAKNDEKILDLRSVLGWEGYGLYWAIVENLREAKQYRLRTNFRAIAMSLGVGEDIIRSIVCDFDLFTIESEDDKEYFYSASLLSRMQEADQRKEVLSEAGRKGAEARWKSRENGPVMAQDSLANADAMRFDGNKIKLKEKKEKENIKPCCCSSSNVDTVEEGKGFSFYSLPEEQRNNEQQLFYENFFFKDFKNPRSEVEKFIEHNETFHWIPRGKTEPLLTTEERLKWSDGWKPKTQPRTNRPDFLAVWKRIYDICARSDPGVASKMLDLRTISGKTAEGKNYIRCQEQVWRWIEANREQVYPILRDLFHKETWFYSNI